MNEDFVPYELAVKLKKKGFNKGCYKYYENKELKWSNSPWLETQYNNYMPHIVAAPTISQVLKWMREEKKIHLIVEIADSGWYYTLYPNIRWENGKLKSDKYFMSFKHNLSYELAAIAGIEYVIDNLI